MTRSKGKARQTSVRPVRDKPLNIADVATNIQPLDVDDETMYAMIKALAYHKATSKYKRDQQCKAQEPSGDKPVGNVTVDQYGWSRQATIMFRPTFCIWWAPMVYRKPVRTGRFYAKHCRTYVKRR